MNNRRGKTSYSEQEYERKLKDLEDLQTLVGLSDKFPSPEDLLNLIIEQVQLRSQSDPLLAKPKKHSKKKCLIT